MSKQAVFAILALTLVVLIMARFLKPKRRVVGGLRPWTGPKAYLEELDCAGIKYNFCPKWPDYGCDYFCLGILYNRRCFNETFNEDYGRQKTPVSCRLE